MRRIIPALCLLLVAALPCQAQGEKAKPNTLTPKEIADGWILLFDGGSMFGWNVDGAVELADGALVFPGQKPGTIVTTTVFGDFELRFDWRNELGDGGDANLVLNGKSYGITPPGNTDWMEARYTIKSGGRSHVVSVSAGKPGQKPVINNEAYPKVAGVSHTSIRISSDAVKHSFRNVKLRPLETKSLFNGKDLTGWKEFPGKKSTFTVSDGAVNVKNGPGDLQTVGKYQDFVLQLDCISNGKHLNSGIFFRCKDNEYQNGYEAQIFNKFSKDATQKYFVEEYDPLTNKLVGKKELMSTAFDFGTGAIYRRVPARKEMSKDGEWFGMTIVAHGNHLATWVNGVQVADWHDHRPKSDNARIGCKLEAGHISIQGHDPTTDLSFKNFRIAELPAAK
jgi:hypothetical protein